MANQGWIRLYRQIQECDIWLDDDESFDKRSAWIDLLLLANHRDKDIIFDGKPLTIGRGQYVTSVRKLAVRWGWGNQKTLNYLRLLEELNMITKDSDTRRTLITIVKYEVYQGGEDNSRTLIDTVSEQYQNADRTQTERKSTTNKNIKNEKNIKNDKNDNKYIYGEFENVRLTEEELQKLMEKFPNDYQERIENLSAYISSKNKKYSSHYATILNWARKESSSKPSAYMDAIKNRVDVVDSWI